MLPTASRRAAVALLAVALAGCAAAPPRSDATAQCRVRFAEIDARVAAAGVRDAGAYSIPGFPYLRADRFLASFRDDVDEPARFDAWVRRLAAKDLEAREVELSNLATRGTALDVAATLGALADCARSLAASELADPNWRETLRQRAVVPDDYSVLQRLFGNYLGVTPFLNLGISGYHDDVKKDFATPLPELSAPGVLLLWRVQNGDALAPAQVAGWLTTAAEDPLGIPNLSPSQWEQLAFAHAPNWQVETAAGYDRPGSPELGKGQPRVDTNRPVTYFQPAYTRFGGRVLIQLVYTVWFPERPSDGSVLDGYSGTLDGIVWRVTLGSDGEPLLYDTIHPCGCYHDYFEAKPLRRRQAGGFFQEAPLFPQDAVPAPPFAIRVQSGTHFVRRLVPLADAAAVEQQTYALAEYNELLQLRDQGRRTRSLFGECGIVDGSERAERFWLWPSGIPSPGAMRQWGRHATAFVGKTHFDDVDLLDRLFEAPR